MRLLRLSLTHADRAFTALLCFMFFSVQSVSGAPDSNQWNQAASNLADQVAAVLGPGQAHMTVRNMSSIPDENVSFIRNLLESDLQAHGVTASGDESANTVNITLS